MAVRQKAIGVAWGVTSSAYTYTATATALPVGQDSQDLKRASEMTPHKNGDGETIGLTFFDPTQELKLRVWPKGATLADAAAANVLPAIGDKFVVTDTADTDIAGTYIVMDCGKQKKVGDKAFFDVSLKKWATDLSADTAAGGS